jgi:hypothetical protein
MAKRSKLFFLLRLPPFFKAVWPRMAGAHVTSGARGAARGLILIAAFFSFRPTRCCAAFFFQHP